MCTPKKETSKPKHLYSRVIASCALGLSLSCHNDHSLTLPIPARDPHVVGAVRGLLTASPSDGVRERLLDIETTLRADSVDAGARLALANVYLERARQSGRHAYLTAAADILDPLPEASSVATAHRYDALVTLGRLRKELGDYHGALHDIQSASRLRPCTARAYGLAFDCHMELGEYAEAERAISEMLSLQRSKCAYARLSKLLEARGDLDGAMDALDEALATPYPGGEGEAWARVELGAILEDYGQPACARTQYELALAKEPCHPDALLALTRLTLGEGDLARASRFLNELERAGGTSDAAYYTSLVRLHRAAGDQRAAGEALARLTSLLDERARAGQNVNLAYADVHIHLTRQYGLALDYVTREYERRPDNIEVNRRLAIVNYLYGDSALALEHLKAARRPGSRHPDLLLVDGLIALDRGDTTAGYDRIEAVQKLSAVVPEPLAEELGHATTTVGR